VTSWDDQRALVQTAVDRFGGVDILYNNAGGPKPGLFDDLTDADWDNAYQLNLMSAVRLTRLCLPHMRRKGWGRVITGTSTSVKQPIANLMLSNSIRSATTAWSKTLADQVAADGITVNTVATGRFATDRLASNWGSWEEMERGAAEGVPAGRLGQPEEYGDVVAFICSERAGYLTGAVIPLDGGLLRSV
jgi:3-oxoacyl-[acyl-carrier protein] reductase